MLVLCAIALSGLWAERREWRLKAQALHQAAQAQTLGLRGIVEKNDYLPFAASQHPDVQALLLHPGKRSLRDNVNHFFADLQGHTDAAALYVIDTQGMTLAASNWNSSDSFVGQNYRQRPYFQDALLGRRGYFYGLGLTTGAPGLFIAEPVRVQQQIIGVIAVKVRLSALEQAWTKSANPIVLQDSRGIVFLSSEPEWLYHSDRALNADDLDWLRQHAQYGERQHYDLLPWHIARSAETDEYTLQTAPSQRARAYLALATALPELGWTLTVTSDMAEVHQARQEARTMATLAATVLVLGLLYWRLHEKRHAEQQQTQRQREQDQQLQRSARLASVGEMASTLAHELNQPLMAVSNFAVGARALTNDQSHPLLVSALDDIVAQSQRASEIVKRVRSFIRPQHNNYEALDLNTVLRHALDLLQPELQRNQVAVQTQLEATLPAVRGDRVLLEQVLVNLVQNAIQALQDLPLSQRTVTVRSRLRENALHIDVMDTGPGIPPAARAQVFSPFFTTKADGLGLGLNICRTIVEAHGGHIAVQDRAGGGAVFSFTLPVSHDR